MRVSFEWLNELVEINCSAEELADKLTMAGIAVEEIEDQGARYRGMIVVRIKEIVKHPEADKLRIAQVDAGDKGTLQIITNATNVNVGDLVPLATVGTILADGHEIVKAKLKGVESLGMFCGGEELGLEKESDGVWIFKEDLQPGTPIAEVLKATDKVLVLELTANRADCMGMINVAREAAAVMGTKLKLPQFDLRESGKATSDLIKIDIEAPDLCPRYSAKVCSGVKLGPSPEWMQKRLTAAGIRPINNVVDITNYVLMEYNQPLHSFDYDKIAAKHIIVRRAKDGETLLTLDDQERKLSSDQLVIADTEQSLCVAGVMGGASSEVTAETTNVLLESAYFAPISIRRTSKALEMRSESSTRFERGIDPNGVINALNRAAYLLQTICGAEVSVGCVDNYPSMIVPTTVKTTYARINSLLGTQLADAEIRKYLESVDFKVTEVDGEIIAEAPSYRRDVAYMADLAEEVARLYGYDNIQPTLPENRGEIGLRTPSQKLHWELRRLLQGNGLSEIYTYSLYAKNTAAKLSIKADDCLAKSVELMDPLTEDQAVMRTTLLDGMLTSMAFNIKRRQPDVAFYEISRVYLPVEGSVLPEEPTHLSIGLTGRFADQGWNQPKQTVDFYSIKGFFELLIDSFKIAKVKLAPSERPYMHPGQAAEIMFGGKSVGYFGQVHPRVLKEYGLSQSAFVLELDTEFLVANRNQNIKFKALPKFPAVQRDLALVLPQEIKVSEIISQIKQLGGELLEQVELFDVYQGEQVAAGCRSLAFSLSYRADDRTLNDQEVQNIQKNLLEKLNQKYGAEIRA